MGFFSKIKEGLKKTRDSMTGAIKNIIHSFKAIDDDFYDELEEALILGDVGVVTAQEIIERLRESVKKNSIKDPMEVKGELRKIIAELLEGGEELNLSTKPSIILVIGVNGVGKTTTIGKLASKFRAEGKKVILGAADTFRAAAAEQLTIWAERSGADIVKHKEGADPAAVIFDTISAAKARGTEIIICDTAGRLHNKKNLMEELGKIYRVIDRELPYSDREVLLVLDATTGQNAVNQAREFAKIAEITGIILTKLDGTARGGVVLSIKNDLKVPVKFIGVGEGIDDLQPFNPMAFAEGLFDDLPEDYEEDDIDLSKIREDIVTDDSGAEDEKAELAKAVGEIFEAMAEINAEENAEAEEIVEEAAEEAAEETAEETVEETVEEVVEEAETTEKVEELVEAEIVAVVEEDDGPTAVFVAEKSEEAEKEEPKKKKGLFGRLFG